MKKLILLFVVISALSCKEQNPVDIRDSVIGTYNSTCTNLLTNELVYGSFPINVTKSTNSDQIIITISVPGSTTGAIDYIKFNCSISNSTANYYTFNIISNQTSTITGKVFTISKYYASRDGYYLSNENAFNVSMILTGNGTVFNYSFSGGKVLN